MAQLKYDILNIFTRRSPGRAKEDVNPHLRSIYMCKALFIINNYNGDSKK